MSTDASMIDPMMVVSGYAAAEQLFLEEQYQDNARAAEEYQYQEPRWKLGPRYDIQEDLEALGQGSYGSVREAYDLHRKRHVAIKRISHLFDELIDCKRILREISILSRLRHDNVVRLHDLVYVPSCLNSFNDLYIVMERCDSDLRKLCATQAHLSMLHVQKLLYNLLLGLHYIHSAGVYHRDLKPANCLVNQDCTVKIADFGLARTVAEGQEQSNQKECHTGRAPVRHLTGHVATRWYRAPELILLQDNYDESIDIWSVGCIFAELLGMLPETRCEDRRPLFPGGCCYPLSPTADGYRQQDYTSQEMLGFEACRHYDQLNIIFDTIGTPADHELHSLDSDARKYVRSYGQRAGAGLRSSIRCLDPGADTAIGLLERMVRFSPQRRILASQAIRHEAFVAVRDPTAERTASNFLAFDFETEPVLDAGVLRRYYREELRTCQQYSVGGC